MKGRDNAVRLHTLCCLPVIASAAKQSRAASAEFVGPGLLRLRLAMTRKAGIRNEFTRASAGISSAGVAAHRLQLRTVTSRNQDFRP